MIECVPEAGGEDAVYRTWQALERAVYRLFKHSGFEDCRLVGGTGDQGADILATKTGRLWVAQVKYRRAAVAVDESAVKEAVHAIGAYSADQAVVITNQHFDPEAYKVAAKYSGELKTPIWLWPATTILKWAANLREFPTSRVLKKGADSCF